ncbi:MAG: alcohol dehydrogenase catalytic domain-containing protein, partial [Actinobacteria bacterium]|nr:alcohol dehydrogenase catalytic domain-containing protein [Actinomycetota bacterium]
MRRVPRCRQPRDPFGDHCPKAWLAGGGLGEGPGRATPAVAHRYVAERARAQTHLCRQLATRPVLMKALQVSRKVARLGLARMVSALSPAAAARIGPIELVNIDPPESLGEGWHTVTTRLSGICGSDLSTIEGHASTYFDDWVSFPFTPGHEVVGELADGTRVVIEPVLGHAARGFPLPFPDAAPGDGDDYAHLALPPLKPGIQTGFCHSTGGGWSTKFQAHDSQLHHVPFDMSDEAAVMVEPAAGGIHSALLCWPTLIGVENPIVAVLGAGTMGLCAIAGLRRYIPNVKILVGARYPHQQSLAISMGADIVVAPGELTRAVRREVGCHVVGDYLSGGAHATIDAVGNSGSIETCLQ